MIVTVTPPAGPPLVRPDPQPDDRGANGPVSDELVQRAQADPHRPRSHFTAPGGWLNDPNGLCQWNGTYHLFYQYNPHAPVHGRIHWGHARSSDLVTWIDEPVALGPRSTGPDRDGCWSGVLVDDAGVPTLAYSGHHDGIQRPCVAVGSADLSAFTADPGNPVIADPPDGVPLHGFRDHCVWRENGRWRQLVGAGFGGEGGSAVLYDSDNLRHWRLIGPLVTAAQFVTDRDDERWTGAMWECIDLFAPPSLTAGAAASDVLVVSACDEVAPHQVLYLTGTYAGDRFAPATLERLDLGGSCFYAPQTFTDGRGRRVMFGWLQEERSPAASIAAGWAGVISVPRELTLGPDGSLWQAPVTEVSSLRRGPAQTAHGALSLGEVIPLGSGVALDLELTLRLRPGAEVEIVLRASPDSTDASERTVLRLTRDCRSDAAGDTPALEVALDRSRSSLDAGVAVTPRRGVVPLTGDEVVLRLLVDHSVLEVFVGGRALSARLYPTRDDAVGAHLSLSRGSGDLESSSCWALSDIWSATTEPRRLCPDATGASFAGPGLADQGRGLAGDGELLVGRHDRDGDG